MIYAVTSRRGIEFDVLIAARKASHHLWFLGLSFWFIFLSSFICSNHLWEPTGEQNCTVYLATFQSTIHRTLCAPGCFGSRKHGMVLSVLQPSMTRLLSPCHKHRYPQYKRPYPACTVGPHQATYHI